jgi:hypothetical protein
MNYKYSSVWCWRESKQASSCWSGEIDFSFGGVFITHGVSDTSCWPGDVPRSLHGRF